MSVALLSCWCRPWPAPAPAQPLLLFPALQWHPPLRLVACGSSQALEPQQQQALPCQQAQVQALTLVDSAAQSPQHQQ
jgi:hypothetical protein